MFLAKMNNPWLSSIATAVTVGAVITFGGAIAIGATNSSKNQEAYQKAVYASLLGTACGGVLDLIKTKKKPEDDTMWRDWRNFVVIRKVKESEEITSFYLQPEDNKTIHNFLPGQFLTIKLDIPGQNKPVIRTYSLSDYPEPLDYYRLSIKREAAPQGLDVMPGLASNFLHDQIKEGSIIPAKPPSGKFVVDVQKSLPAVLISNGVGITPMISMAKAISQLNPQRPIWFLHGARDGSFHAFRDEIKTLARGNFNLHLHFAYSRPRLEDEGNYHSVGYIDVPLIRSLLNEGEAEYFLCGSPPFMDSIREGLKNAGVPNSQVFFEMFTKAMKTASPSQPTTGETKEVTFNQSGQTATWSSGSLLELAESSGLTPPYSCRQGICGTCQCRLVEGEVEYIETPTADIEEGSVLICISQPKTPQVVLEL